MSFFEEVFPWMDTEDITGGDIGRVLLDPGDVFGTGEEQAMERSTEESKAKELEGMEMQERLGMEGLALQREMWETGRADMMPWMQAGKRGLAGLEQEMNRPFEFDLNDPMYKRRLQEQSKAFGMSGASKGMLLSGRTLGGLRDITSAELDRSYRRQWGEKQSRLDRLSSLSGLGQRTSSQQQQAGGLFGAQGSQTLSGIGEGWQQTYSNLGQMDLARDMGSAQRQANTNQTALSLASMYYTGGAA